MQQNALLDKQVLITSLLYNKNNNMVIFLLSSVVVAVSGSLSMSTSNYDDVVTMIADILVVMLIIG